jgi:predicted protein tyrosine phosphatase
MSHPEQSRLHVLFVCSRNQWRSPTAEQTFRRHPRLEVRSAGTASSARRPLSADDIRWADVIVLMEDKHRRRIAADFARLLVGKIVHVLDIPDDYRYMDPELVAILQQSVPGLLGIE